MICPYCGSGSAYVVELEDGETYYCYECGSKFKY
jgi:DNA-directed RNA polymerase subunit RPC12/RpoP